LHTEDERSRVSPTAEGKYNRERETLEVSRTFTFRPAFRVKTNREISYHLKVGKNGCLPKIKRKANEWKIGKR